MKRIAFIGGDKRMNRASKYLSERGFDSVCINDHGNYKKEEYFNALKDAMVVLPSPLTIDGVHIRNTADLTIYDICERMSEDSVLFSGKLDICGRDIVNINYMNDEKYLSDMAYLTAEGALGHLLLNSECALSESSVLILGWGRIAKYLYRLIMPLAKNVFVILRNERIKNELTTKRISAHGFKEASSIISRSDIILNTIPERVLSYDDLSACKDGAYLAELASLPGGYDPDDADKLKIDSYKLAALPGKCAPRSAGEMLGKCIEKYLVTMEN